MKKLLRLLLICFALPVMASNVQQMTLSNGMKVVVLTDHRSPVVMTQLWYNVGSSDERLGETGISHFLEHMMFRGTQAYAPGEFATMISSRGGEDNAFTSRDATVYYLFMHKQYLPLMLKMEADRMKNLLLSTQSINTERKVVLEERTGRVEDSPLGYTYERVNALAFTGNPYQTPIVGFASDIKQVTPGELKRWYQQYYVPNNATLVIAGDVDPQDAFQKARSCFEGITPQALPLKKDYPYVANPGRVDSTISRLGQIQKFVVAYRVPSLLTAKNKKDAYALVLLSTMLGGMKSSILDRGLIRDRGLATSAYTQYNLLAKYPTDLKISLQPVEGVDHDYMVRMVRNYMNNIAATLSSDDLLRRAKAVIHAQYVYAQDSLRSQSRIVGKIGSLGLPLSFKSDYLSHIDAVSEQDIQRVIIEYLVADNMTEVWFQPRSEVAYNV